MNDAVSPQEKRNALNRSLSRRNLIRGAAGGTVITALGGAYVLSDDLTREAQAKSRQDGRPRVPPGQRVLSELKPMGGTPGEARASRFKLKVHGEVERPFEVTLAELAKMNVIEPELDVHCVTGWTVLDARFRGVQVRELAKKAGIKKSARYVIFEAAHGYTANTTLENALHKDVLVSWMMNGKRLARGHGAPARIINPNQYFWKSPKWITGIRFVSRDEPGYWEVRGYNNTADPWKQQRYA